MIRDIGGNKGHLSDRVADEHVQQLRLSGAQVECLGMTFENDSARKAYFLSRLREKLSDPKFRKIEGFPIGKDEDILALSDPPYYTACPNPFIGDFIKFHESSNDLNVTYTREPFAADVSEGKNDPIYNAHSYHTKVPHKAIMKYILHYTEPGDMVFDGFCGTGMTGVAAQLCSDRATVESLGYRVEPDGTILHQKNDESGKTVWKPFSKLGMRRIILNDLSPAATFIAYNYNTPIDVQAFERDATHILNEVEEESGWMYWTLGSGSPEVWAEKLRACKTVEEVRKLLNPNYASFCTVNYTIWSDVFVCPECTNEVVFWNAAVDKEAGKMLDEFPCPHCSARLTKRSMDHSWITKLDTAIGQPIRQAKHVPVLINYHSGKKNFEKMCDDFDLALIEKIEKMDILDWFPTDRMMEGEESRRNDDIGITHVHHFYTKRNLSALASILDKSSSSLCRWLVTGVMQRASKQHQIAISRIGGPKEGEGGATAGHRRGTLYIPSNQVEFNPFLLIKERLKMSIKALRKTCPITGSHMIETVSTTDSLVEDNCVDYIFTDPPFGGNIMYSELNQIWESVLKIKTNSNPEAITNKVQKKSLIDYQALMCRCFFEYYRTLKPGRWMTIEFHNSQNSVWSSIQGALQRAGFVIADVRVLDKKIKTHTQRTAGGSVNKDLAITAYKPNSGLEDRFKLEAGTEEGVWDFCRTHLKQLPVFVSKDGQAEVIAERQNYLLFDRMVAFHVQRGVTIPLSASEFYAGLVQRFFERDGMFFLPEQVTEYDKKRMTAREVLQLQLCVTDESSAIQWLKQQIIRKPQTFQEIHPQFLKEIGGWQKHETPLELSELLEQNFLRYEGEGEVPGSIHSYLSTTYKELRNLSKTDPALVSKARNRWYVPDPRRAGDLEKLREKALLKEFHLIADSKKKMKEFRIEAVRAGFKKCWDEGDHKTILDVAKKLPTNVVEEDSHLLMYTDLARMRQG